MTYSHQETHTTQAALKDAIDHQSFETFNENYVSFLKQFDSFGSSLATGVTEVPSSNAIFGKIGFYLNQTNDEQGKQLLERARSVSNVMAKVPLEDRLAYLDILERKIEKYKDAIMTTITADTGKPIKLAEGEMAKGKEWFAFAREEAQSQLGSKHVKNLRNRSTPRGAIQVIGAYNYPYALAIGGIVGGLMAGNGVIVSAPLKAPNWVFPFMQAASEAATEFAEKAHAEGKPYAEALAASKDGLVQNSIGVNAPLTREADAVHFVGGDKVGEFIRHSRGKKKTILEMGGSNVVTVMKSALDTIPADEIAQTIYAGFGPATGQRCTAPRMLCIQHGAEEVVRAISAICDQGPSPDQIGNPFQPGIQMGPLVDRGAHQKMEEAIALAKELGAEVHGTLKVSNNIVPLANHDQSFWVNPIVIDWSNVDMANPENARRVHHCLKDEIFGPLLHIVHPIKTLEEAIHVTNHLDTHKLAAALFTNDANDIDTYADGIHVTSLAINGAPKDQSPRGPHGHPGLEPIGGDSHFGLYANHSNIGNMRS